MRDTDVAAAVRAVVAACPDLGGLPLVVHDSGWDSLGLEFGDTWICKVSRDEDAGEALRREAAVLSIVRPLLTLPVPDMAVVAGPPLFTRHRKLPGVALSCADYEALDDSGRDRLAADVGGFLAELHAIEADWVAIGVEPEETYAADAEAGFALLADALRPAAEAALRDHAALGADPLGAGLCYLDAHGLNFAFDTAAGRLNGIFDFGDVAIADRHEEFVEPAYISRDCARRVIAAYEARTGRSVDRARVETLIGYQRLMDLAEDADHPMYGAHIRAVADDWFRAPRLI